MRCRRAAARGIISKYLRVLLGTVSPLMVSPHLITSRRFYQKRLNGVIIVKDMCRSFSTQHTSFTSLSEYDETGDDNALEDYEEFLLNSSDSGTPTGHLGDSASDNGELNRSSSAAKLVEDILELLPTDGTALRLTMITPLLDVQSISELYGSVREFVQLFPHRFRCYKVEDLDAGPRWFIGRAGGLSSSTCIGNETSVPREVIANGKAGASKLPVRVRLQSIEAKDTEKVMQRVLQHLKDTLPPDKPVSTAGLLQTLPTELRESVRVLSGGVLRLLKSAAAADYVDLSLDTTLVGRKGTLSSTFHNDQQQNRITVRDSIPVGGLDFAEDAWEVELNLDEEETSLDNDAESDQPDEDFLHGDNAATATVPRAPDVPTLTIPQPPPKPPDRLEKRRTPPPIRQKPKDPRPCAAPSRLSPDDLLRAHTAMAQLHGKRSPAELLDLFVECIPTVYVPVQKLRVTDALARVMGPRNTLHKIIGIYSYYFDRDKMADTVRLKASIKHPRLGVANVLYTDAQNETADRKLQGTDVTRAFPVLQAPLRTTGVVKVAETPKTIASAVSHISKISSPRSPVDLSPSPEWFALLDAIPYDRYIDVTEWSQLSSVSLDDIKSFTARTSELHYFLTKPMSDGTTQWRLRPYWLAPYSTAEVSINDSEAATLVARHLRPIWMPIPRLLEKLTTDERKCVIEASEKYGNTISLFRTFGRFCWVDERGANIRRYCAAADLDDILHVSVTYLHSVLSTDFVSLQDIIQSSHQSNTKESKRLPHPPDSGVLQLLSHGLKVMQKCTTEQTETIRQRNEEENVFLFLKRHGQKLDIQVKENLLLIARRSPFRRKTAP